jgi:hypothetical protein
VPKRLCALCREALRSKAEEASKLQKEQKESYVAEAEQPDAHAQQVDAEEETAKGEGAKAAVEESGSSSSGSAQAERQGDEEGTRIEGDSAMPDTLAYEAPRETATEETQAYVAPRETATEETQAYVAPRETATEEAQEGEEDKGEDELELGETLTYHAEATLRGGVRSCARFDFLVQI